jgi:DNA-binding NarL/FixJ family response regulator
MTMQLEDQAHNVAETPGEPVARGLEVTSVVVVDDHPIVRRGLVDLINAEADLQVCGEAGTRAEALQVVRAKNPQLVLLDICLPGESGLGLVKELAGDYRVLVLSMYEELLYAERALSAGALGYVAKYEPVERLLEGIRSVLQGKLYVSKSVADRLLHRIARPGPQPDGDVAALSDRELEVFQMIGKGVATRDIAAALHLSPKTVETHRENIKRKLNLKSGSELVVRATAWMLEHK